jgi:RNA polymerase sigma-70 factor (ECF subfamily)
MPLQTTITDQQIIPLLKGCQRGEAAAAEAIYDLYADRMYRYFLAHTGDAHTAEDLTGELFLRMIEHIGRFRVNAARPGASFSAWMYRIAANLTTDHHRRSRRYVDAPEDEELVGPGAPDPAQAAERREAMAALSGAMQQLTEEQRLVLIARFGEGLSNREVAELLGKNEGSVESMQHRALRRLGGLLRGKRS